MSLDLSSWLTDAEVCARLDISPRSLDRKAPHLHPQHRPVPGRTRPERVWDPEKIAALMPAPPVQVTMDSPRNLPIAPAIAPVAPPMAELAQFNSGLMNPDQAAVVVGVLLERLVEARKPPAPYIDLKTAAGETGLSKPFLRRLIEHRALPAVRDVAIKVHRGDLEELDVSSEMVKPAGKAAKKRQKKGRAK